MEVANGFTVSIKDGAARRHFSNEVLIIDEASSCAVDGPEDDEAKKSNECGGDEEASCPFRKG